MDKLREWVDRHRTVFHRVAHMLETVTLVLVVAMGGALGGYALGQWQAQWQAQAAAIQQRADHVAEIERMQRTYALTLQALAPKITAIAETASAAAGAAAEAAVSSAEVAQTAKRAAQGKAAAPSPLTEAERARANSAIEAANRRVTEGGR